VDWIHIILFGGAILIALLCAAAIRTSSRFRRAKASRLAEDLEMELLASDNPNTLIVAGEVNDRASTIRYQHENSSLDLLRMGLAKKPASTQEELLVSVECACGIDFKIEKSDQQRGAGVDHISVALLNSSGLALASKDKEKAAFIFEEPETAQSLIDLFNRSGACSLSVCENKVSALIYEESDAGRAPAKVAEILESLDRFARLLEFVSEEHHAVEN